eukprot:1369327-Rhodomonas_salina.1
MQRRPVSVQKSSTCRIELSRIPPLLGVKMQQHGTKAIKYPENRASWTAYRPLCDCLLSQKTRKPATRLVRTK